MYYFAPSIHDIIPLIYHFISSVHDMLAEIHKNSLSLYTILPEIEAYFILFQSIKAIINCKNSDK
ncbi:MAG TPA: hypothetical protein DDW85_08975 [Porphyromonadaceae bacterium]|nr:hypothetical protein [Porphyromonadaceae bacterium]